MKEERFNKRHMKVVIYLRVSTEEQRQKQTIQTQRRFAERFFAVHNILVQDWYADDGVSGTLPLSQRPEGARLLADARAGIIEVVYVYQLDRLGRDALVILNSINELETSGVQVKSMKEAFDTTNPAGRFQVAILGGVAGLERDTIVERSIAGTNRLARGGAWLGGVVPYGYRAVGTRQDSRLTVSEQQIPGFKISEAEVVRTIYRIAAEEGKSCHAIAAHLNALGIPPKSKQDESEPPRGKRLKSIAHRWSAGHVRNMITSTTYKGLHRYGRRTQKRRDIYEREVPAIVSPEIWERAQQTLRDHALPFLRVETPTRPYLLRGLIKCGLCGLTYIGKSSPPHNNTERAYYACNGKSQPRGLYGAQGKKCPSKNVNALAIESAIWQDIQTFLRNPGAVIEQLAAMMQVQEGETEGLRAELAKGQQSLQALDAEKDKVITLYRRGRIDESDLDRQLDEVQQEEEGVRGELAVLQERLRSVQEKEEGLRGALELLKRLARELEEPITWELRRQLVEALVEGVRVDTVQDGAGRKEAHVTVTYRFGPSTALGTGMGSSQPQA